MIHAIFVRHYNLCTNWTTYILDDDWDKTSAVYLYVTLVINYLCIAAMTTLCSVVVFVFSSKEEEHGDRTELRSKIVRNLFPPMKAKSTASHHYGSSDANLQDSCCPICLEEWEQGCVVATSLCSHAFHRDCIIEWSERKTECPVCRQAMWKSERYDKLLEFTKRIQQEEPSRCAAMG